MASTVSDVHLDILRGKDESLDLGDVFVARTEEAMARVQLSSDLHLGMQNKLGL